MEITSIDSSYILLAAAFVLSLFISWYSIPSIIKISFEKGLIDIPDQRRKKHERLTCNLGGIAIFFALAICSMIFIPNLNGFFMSALLILFFLGLKDDVVPISAHHKLIGQFIAASLVVFGTSTNFPSLYGVLGIYELPYFASVILSLFVFVTLINAYNLIDGIDGLAASVGVFISTVLGIWFMVHGYASPALLAFILCGSLIGFLRFNLHPAHIFMGDSGAMLIGFTLTYLSIRFINLSAGSSDLIGHWTSAPALAVALLSIPIFDTLRVFTIRVLKKRSPFSPDRLHLHHYLKDMGLNDLSVVGWLILGNTTITATVFLFADWDVNYLILLIIGTCFFLTILTYFLKKKMEVPKYFKVSKRKLKSLMPKRNKQLEQHSKEFF
ncbi:MAG: MraY family glycosyltransferase [Balneolales bacterium]